MKQQPMNRDLIRISHEDFKHIFPQSYRDFLEASKQFDDVAPELIEAFDVFFEGEEVVDVFAVYQGE